ncbi:hypothetical protein LSUE1_G008261 [Lachnellula suecica]|uniref:Zn(2)-C6 fungal-type domain-containing protein n=1 Tax=Lachnellula suecica TaxID=602035 RepID=A0A8T9BVS2_9HELO|nr:hypothetical protein LSUE1_G008261 [Lachnellula suecica]
MASRGGVGVGTVQARRRNGKQQACEPCRKAKIACDHSLPVCERCKRRKVAERCVYLDAPMTRPAPGFLSSPPGIEIRRGPERHQSLPTPSTSTSAPSIASPPPSKSVRSPAPSGPFIKSGGFFGPTNFSAVFLENHDNLVSGNEDMQISNDSDQPLPPSESLQSQTFLMLASGETASGSPRVALGAKVLRALPDKNTCNFLLEWYYEKTCEVIYLRHTVLRCAKSLWETYGSYLEEPRTAENLQHVSAIFSCNSTKVLEEPSGVGETVGIVFSALVSATLSLPEKDAFFCTQRGERKDRKAFAVEMKDCVQACITLSNWMDLINLPMVALLAKNLVLQTVISGDASLVVWRQLGDLVSSSTALGLHRQMATEQPISFLTELKKRIFTVIFNLDKNASALNGRPPALSYRYTRFKYPLDLSDEVLMAGGDELHAAVNRLDKDGWNTDGEIYPATYCRANGTLSVVLDEILELSLGDPSDCTEEKTKTIMARLRKAYNAFPPWLHFSLAEPAGGKRGDFAFWRTLCTRTSYLEHQLLLERIAFKQGWLSGQSMVDCATEMLELTVLIWVQRDRFVEHHHDFDWMLMVWGVPSCGVLCVELLKQLKSPGAPGPRLKRSEIVQNLSLLIGFFEWVRPAAGNYQLCLRMRLIVKRILDQILDPSPPSSAPIPASQTSGHFEPMDVAEGQPWDPSCVTAPFDFAVPPPGAFDISSYENGADNLDWLNSIDWSRGPWIDFGQDFGGVKWSGGV